jgi:hypothetical protein
MVRLSGRRKRAFRPADGLNGAGRFRNLLLQHQLNSFREKVNT